MTTERDITGNMWFLVEAWKKHDAITSAMRNTDLRGALSKKHTDMIHEREQIELGMKQAATDLAVGFLVDLHRCADALESIAHTESDRLMRGIQR